MVSRFETPKGRFSLGPRRPDLGGSAFREFLKNSRIPSHSTNGVIRKPSWGPWVIGRRGCPLSFCYPGPSLSFSLPLTPADHGEGVEMGSALSDPLGWDWPHWGQAAGGRKLAFPNLIKAERRPKGETAPFVARSLRNFKQRGAGEGETGIPRGKELRGGGGTQHEKGGACRRKRRGRGQRGGGGQAKGCGERDVKARSTA